MKFLRIFFGLNHLEFPWLDSKLPFLVKMSTTFLRPGENWIKLIENNLLNGLQPQLLLLRVKFISTQQNLRYIGNEHDPTMLLRASFIY